MQSYRIIISIKGLTWAIAARIVAIFLVESASLKEKGHQSLIKRFIGYKQAMMDAVSGATLPDFFEIVVNSLTVGFPDHPWIDNHCLSSLEVLKSSFTIKFEVELTGVENVEHNYFVPKVSEMMES